MASMETHAEAGLPEGWRMENGIIRGNKDMPDDHLQMIKQISLHQHDVIVIGFPKCGNTWMMTTVGAILAPDLYVYRSSGPTFAIGPIELLPCWVHIKKKLASRPTVLMSHLPYEYLPDEVRTKGNKIINIARNPKDAAVSLHNFSKMNKVVLMMGDFDVFLKMFLRGIMLYGGWFDYMKRWLGQKDNPNVLMVQYEQFINDPCAVIKKVANFLDRDLTDDKIQRISEMVSFNKMRENPNMNVKSALFDENKGQFLRKGRVGDWKNYFNEKQSKAFDVAYEEFVKDTGYVIPFE